MEYRKQNKHCYADIKTQTRWNDPPYKLHSEWNQEANMNDFSRQEIRFVESQRLKDDTATVKIYSASIVVDFNGAN